MAVYAGKQAECVVANIVAEAAGKQVNLWECYPGVYFIGISPPPYENIFFLPRSFQCCLGFYSLNWGINDLYWKIKDFLWERIEKNEKIALWCPNLIFSSCSSIKSVILISIYSCLFLIFIWRPGLLWVLICSKFWSRSDQFLLKETVDLILSNSSVKNSMSYFKLEFCKAVLVRFFLHIYSIRRFYQYNKDDFSIQNLIIWFRWCIFWPTQIRYTPLLTYAKSAILHIRLTST